jgi:hypothetical protein
MKDFLASGKASFKRRSSSYRNMTTPSLFCVWLPFWFQIMTQISSPDPNSQTQLSRVPGLNPTLKVYVPVPLNMVPNSRPVQISVLRNRNYFLQFRCRLLTSYGSCSSSVSRPKKHSFKKKKFKKILPFTW